MFKPTNLLIALIALLIAGCSQNKKAVDSTPTTGKLKVSENGRFLVKEDGSPFFWLGDTGWLLFGKLTREEADQYLEKRKEQGFNVVQVMVMHTVPEHNVYGDSASAPKDVSKLYVTEGSDPRDSVQYDYWDHVDYMIDKAAEKGIYMALVPVWGSPVKAGLVTSKQAEVYAKFLAERYKDRPNIIWLNGGDIKGSDSIEVWKTIGKTLRKYDPNHLITFHPRGRTTSSEWFHNEDWLDFNMFQSGHRRYEQDTSKNEKRHYGEDNYKFILEDFALKPVKPSIDGEPSYEGIPQGLHDTLQPRWKDSDVRRYAYWSVFAGGFGYTYGENSVMQFHNAKDKSSAYGSHRFWSETINDPGANQMKYIKELMLSRPFLERVADQSMVADQGEKYNYIAATRGKDYAFVYTYNGRNFKLNMGKIEGGKVKASWFSPRDGKIQEIGELSNTGVQSFDPPAEPKDGNDWVLILDKE